MRAPLVLAAGLGIMLGVGLAARRVAHAEPSTAGTEVERVFGEGRTLLERGDALGACAKFQVAIELDPTAPGVMLNLGLCNERLGKPATSLYWYRKAQTAAAEARLPEYVTAATDHTVALAANVATVRIDASHAPPGVEVRVDGRLVSRLDYGRVEVDATSEIDATAESYRPFHRSLALQTRDGGTVAIELVPEDRGRGQRRTAYLLGAAGVLAMGGGITYSIVVKHDYDSDSDASAHDARTKIRYIGTGLFVAGAALVTAGVVLYLTAPRTPRDHGGTAFGPLVTPSTLGIAALGSF